MALYLLICSAIFTGVQQCFGATWIDGPALTEQCFTFNELHTTQTPTRMNQRVVTTNRGWDSFQITSGIAEIILREFLLYDIRAVSTPDGGFSNWGPNFEEKGYDFTVEEWQNPPGSEYFDDYINQRKTVMHAGETGYYGRSGLYTVQQRLNQNEFSSYYSFFKDVPRAAAAGYRLHSQSKMYDYYTSASVTTGCPTVTTGASAWCGEHKSGYYIPPNCRADPGKCLEVTHPAPDIDPGYFETMTINNGINAVFAYYGWGVGTPLKESLTEATTPIIYWYAPDPLLQALSAIRISFPDTFIRCMDKNPLGNDPAINTNFCDYADVPLAKLTSKTLYDDAPPAYYFLNQFTISTDEINHMFSQHKNGGGSKTSSQLACEFVRANMAKVAIWAPQCIVNPVQVRTTGALWFNPVLRQCQVDTVLAFSTVGNQCFAANDPLLQGIKDRSSTIVKLVHRSWASSEIATGVVGIVLKELLGYTVQLMVPVSGDDGWGNDMEMNLYDIDVEQWKAKDDSAGTLEFINQKGIAIRVGVIGYSGRSGAYVLPRLAAAAEFADWYVFYQDVARAGAKGALLGLNSPDLQNFLGAGFPVCTQASNPQCSAPGTPSEGFYVPTACVADPSLCLQFMHMSPDRDRGYFEQVLKNNNINAVFAYYGANLPTKVREVAAATGPSPMFYYWEPTGLIVSTGAVRVSFPDHFGGCTLGSAQGTTYCDYASVPLWKIAAVSFSVRAKEAYYFLKKFRMSATELNWALQLHTDGGGSDDAPQVACKWIKHYMTEVKAMAPPCITYPKPLADVMLTDQYFSNNKAECLTPNPELNQYMIPNDGEMMYRTCPSGHVPTTNQKDCKVCQAGKATSDGITCVDCSAGRYTDTNGNTLCVKCATGTSNELGGQTACVPCSKGFFQPDRGGTSCRSCNTVRAGTVTDSTGQSSNASCVCAPEMYLTPADVCQACPEGMECPIGSAAPTATDPGIMTRLEGFWTSAETPLEVYRCVPKEVCPGGLPAVCVDPCAEFSDKSACDRSRRVGLACASCPDGYAATDIGCSECSGLSSVAIVCCILGMIIVPLLLYHVLHATHHWKLTPRESLVIACEMTIEVIQIMGVLGMITIEWPDPMSGAVNNMQHLTLEIDALIPTTCMTLSSLNSVRYLMSVALVPGALVIIFFDYQIGKHLPGRFKWKFSAALNLICKIFNTIFISQVSTGVLPFICYSHPGGHSKSVFDYPATICGSSDHVAMSIMGACSMALAVAFFCYVCFEMWRAPGKLNSVNGDEYMEQIVFSIEDFKSGAYYFNIWMKVQEFLLSMVPVVNPDEPRHQITMFLVIFLLSIVCVTRVWPFKAPLLSAVMVVIYSLILLVLTGAKDILPQATSAVQLESAKTMFGFAITAFAVNLGFVVNCLANLIMNKKTLFASTMLRGEPHYEAIKNMWSTAKDLDPEALVKCVHHWEIFHATKLETILPVLYTAINSDGRSSKPVLSPRSFSKNNEKNRKANPEQEDVSNQEAQNEDGTDGPNYSVSV